MDKKELILQKGFNKLTEVFEEKDNEEGCEFLTFDEIEDILRPYIYEYKKQAIEEFTDKLKRDLNDKFIESIYYNKNYNWLSSIRRHISIIKKQMLEKE